MNFKGTKKTDLYFSEGFKPHEGIIKRITRIREAHFDGMLNVLIGKQRDLYGKLYSKTDNKNKEYKECLRYSTIPKVYDIDYTDITIENLKMLSYLICIIIFVSFIVLIYEV